LHYFCVVEESSICLSFVVMAASYQHTVVNSHEQQPLVATYQFQENEERNRKRRLWLIGSLVIVLIVISCLVVVPAMPQRAHNNKRTRAFPNSTTTTDNDNNVPSNNNVSDPQLQKDLLNHPKKLRHMTNGTTTTDDIHHTTTTTTNATSLSELHSGCEATVLLIRHCEKTGPLVTDAKGHQHCSYLGWERSYFLTTLFGNSSNTEDDGSTSPTPLPRRWPLPSLLYALSPKRRSSSSSSNEHEQEYNFREWETLMPLASKYNLPVHVQYEQGYPLALEIFDQLQRGNMCGKLILISWKHNLFVELATALGCGPDDGCPTYYPEESFDQVWQIKYVYNVQEAMITTGTRSSSGGGGNAMDQTIPSSENNHTLLQEQVKTDDTISRKTIPSITIAATSNDEVDDETGPERHYHRRLRHHHHHHHKRDSLHLQPNSDRTLQKGEWSIYATVSYQNFDPLQYSHQAGDYPMGGSDAGGSWANLIERNMATTTGHADNNKDGDGDEM
jgi:hypothetical protein